MQPTIIGLDLAKSVFNRLKAIKRTMYGRAGLDLLRARVLSHA